MTGQELREWLKKSHSLTEIAKELGYTPQAFHSKLESKDVTVSFLESIAKVINKSLYEVVTLGKSGSYKDLPSIGATMMFKEGDKKQYKTRRDEENIQDKVDRLERCLVEVYEALGNHLKKQ